jgi:two-component system, OmpR family, heavy metal sensor histidine kinase CusS
MFLRRNKTRSIATELVVLFTLAAALLLSCALGSFYWLVVQHASAEDNAVLADKVRLLRGELQEPDGLRTIIEELRGRRGETTVYWVRILDPEGNVFMETPGMDQLLPANVFPQPEKRDLSFRHPKKYRTHVRLLSLVSMVEEIRGQTYTIQVAQDRSADEQFQEKFGALLGFTVALGTVASALIAITVTSRGLRPLREMTRSLARISPAHLNERLTPVGWPREIDPLVRAFDDMLDRLEDSFQRLSQFSADLAHELRTPIGNLLGEAQVALTRARTAEEYREIIESSVAECERLAGIVDNLLFLARAEAADRQCQPSLFDGRAAIEKVAAYYQPVAEERRLKITCSGEGEIFADPALFSRALNNLVENSLRFTPDGGSIEIALGVNSANATVAVSDTGAGIAPEHLPHVFDRFYRADSSRSSAGTGLGLSLVKSIAELHGGSVNVESKIGHATTVMITFPNPPNRRLTDTAYS